MNVSENPMVSVCMITYNHEPYIRQAIEGVLVQQCQFPIEIVIGEDCSTDNTRFICEEYYARYPQLIKLLKSDFNLGMIQNFIRTLKNCTGKYIALCEGDDYWTDHYKLQKQVNLLEMNDKISLVHSNFTLQDELNNRKETLSEIPLPKLFNTNYLIQVFSIRTCTVLLRNNRILCESFPSHLPYGDYPLFLKASLLGNIAFIDDYTAVYRRNSSGITQRTSYRIAELNRLNILQWFKCDYPEFRMPVNFASAYLIEKYLYKMRNSKNVTSDLMTRIFLYFTFYFTTIRFKGKIVKLRPLSFIKSVIYVLWGKLNYNNT